MRRQLWFVAVIAVVLFLAPRAVRGQEYVFAPDDGIVERLLDPRVGVVAKLPWFHELELRPGWGWSHLHRVVEQVESKDGERRAVARWLLMAMVGPDGFSRLTAAGPEARSALTWHEARGRAVEFERLRAYAKVKLPTDYLVDWGADTLARRLLDPKLPRSRVIALFWELESRPLGGMTVVPAVLELARSDDPAQRKQAEWVLWCLVGPGWYHRLLDRGDDGRIALAQFHELLRSTGLQLFRWRDEATRWLRNADLAVRRKGVAVVMSMVRLQMRVVGRVDDDVVRLVRLAWDADPSSRDSITRLAVEREVASKAPLIVADGNISDGDRATAERMLRSQTAIDGGVLAEILQEKVRGREAGLERPKAEGGFLLEMLYEGAERRALAEDFLKLMGPAARTAAIAHARRKLAGGQNSALETLTKWGEEKHPATRIAMAIREVDPKHRESLMRILDDPASAVELLPFMFAGKDLEARKGAMTILAVGGNYLDGPKVLRGIARAAGKLEPEVARMVPVESKELVPALVKLIGDEDPAIRLGAIALVAGVSKKDDAVLAAIKPLLKDSDERVRQLAAEGIGTERARSMARLPAVLEDLRASDKGTRMAAARRFESLEVFDRAVGAALMRATDGGNMAAREGLLGAIERAYAADREDVWAVLTEMSEGPVSLARTYARAALREVGQK